MKRWTYPVLQITFFFSVDVLLAKPFCLHIQHQILWTLTLVFEILSVSGVSFWCSWKLSCSYVFSCVSGEGRGGGGGGEGVQGVCRSALMIRLWSSAVNPLSFHSLSTSSLLLPPFHPSVSSPSTSVSLVSLHTLLNVLSLFSTRPLRSIDFAYGSLLTRLNCCWFKKSQSAPQTLLWWSMKPKRCRS